MKNLRLYLTDKQKCSTCRGLSENTNINVSHRMSAHEFHSQFLGRMDGWMDGCRNGPMAGKVWIEEGVVIIGSACVAITDASGKRKKARAKLISDSQALLRAISSKSESNFYNTRHGIRIWFMSIDQFDGYFWQNWADRSDRCTTLRAFQKMLKPIFTQKNKIKNDERTKSA